MESVRIDLGSTVLAGDLYAPRGVRGVVLFGHCGGSGRQGLRSRLVARALHWAGFGTLLVDLLTPAEGPGDENNAHLRFDLEALATRLAATTDWLQRDPRTAGLPVGYFGAGTVAGAALVAASRRPALVGAIVAGGGRTDLAGGALGHVRAPTLLVVGEGDTALAAINREDVKRMRGPARLELVPRVARLFEEPGAIDRLARLAAEWFERRMPPRPALPAALGAPA